MAERSSTDGAAEADPSDGRNETLNQRLDRNWNEMLQELRVTQTGTQILTGFLLTIAFQQRFADLDTFQHRVYLILVIAAVLTTALGLARSTCTAACSASTPRPRWSRWPPVCGSALSASGLVLTGTVLLIFDVVVGLRVAVIAAGGTLLVLIAIALLPVILRTGSPASRPDAAPARARRENHDQS